MNIRNTIVGLIVAVLCLGSSSQAYAQTAKHNFNSLLPGSQLLAPATFQLSAYAVAAAGKTIEKVEFFNGNTVMGNATLSSMANIYTLDVPGQGVGSYTIKARSTDNTGTIKTTGSVTVTVREGKVYGAPGAITPVPYYTSASPYGYNEYLPGSYDPDDAVKKWPLVISLHGSGGQPGVNATTGQININELDQALSGVLEAITMNGLKLPAVVLQPQTDGDLDDWESVDAFITYALARYNVDPDRVYLTGHSWGANVGALTYAGGGTNVNPNSRRLAALFPMCGGSFNSNKTRGIRMANLPIWNFASWGDHVGGSKGTINAINYAAGVIPYDNTTDAPSSLRDLLFSFSTVGRETFDGGVKVVTSTATQAEADSMTVPKFIPLQDDEIDAERTVSHANGAWEWQLGKIRNPTAKHFLTLLPGNEHVIWDDAYAVSDLWTWVFQQKRNPVARSVFKAERFASLPARVSKSYSDTLTANTIAPDGRERVFTRDSNGPACLQVASNGALSGTPTAADIGMNVWDITVTTTDSTNLPITETAELLLMVEVPGYANWWQKQNGYEEYAIPAIKSGPTGDDDGDGHTNFFEFITGSDPLLHTSDPRRPTTSSTPYTFVGSFTYSISPVNENPSQLQITYGPLIRAQTYIIKSTDSLTSGTWTTENSFTPNAAMATRVVNVSNASTLARFYTIEIQKP